MRPYGRTRLYFFYFKRSPNGVLLSDPGMVTAVKAWAMDQQVTIPMVGPEIKYIERPPLDIPDEGDWNLPVAEFSIDDDTVLVGYPVEFTDETVINGGVSKLLWSIEGETFHGDFGASVSHRFRQAGLHKVSLTAYARDGLATSTKVRGVTVSEATVPTANFTWDIYDPEAGEEVTFIDQSINVGDVSFAYWNFGDGTTTSATVGQNVAHTFASAGTYTVSLELTNFNGATVNKKVISLLVYPVGATTPVPGLTITPASPTIYDVISFSDASTTTSDILWAQLDMGDG